MELYFKDFEEETGSLTADAQCGDDATAFGSPEPAEEDAFAELAERVSAARLVY